MSLITVLRCNIQGVPKKRTPLVYFDDNFGKYGPILTIFSLLQQEIYDAQTLTYFIHLLWTSIQALRSVMPRIYLPGLA